MLHILLSTKYIYIYSFNELRHINRIVGHKPIYKLLGHKNFQEEIQTKAGRRWITHIGTSIPVIASSKVSVCEFNWAKLSDQITCEGRFTHTWF